MSVAKWTPAKVQILGNVTHVGSYRWMEHAPGVYLLEVREERAGSVGACFVYGPGALYRLEETHASASQSANGTGPGCDLRARIAASLGPSFTFAWSPCAGPRRQIPRWEFERGTQAGGTYWVIGPGGSPFSLGEWISITRFDNDIERAIEAALNSDGSARKRTWLVDRLMDSGKYAFDDIQRVIGNMVDRLELALDGDWVYRLECDIPF